MSLHDLEVGLNRQMVKHDSLPVAPGDPPSIFAPLALHTGCQQPATLVGLPSGNKVQFRRVSSRRLLDSLRRRSSRLPLDKSLAPAFAMTTG